MLFSMTGFGQSDTQIRSSILKVEIKSLNSKFLDINLKLSRELSKFEGDVRSIVKDLLKRGKINIQIELTTNQEIDAVINESLLKSYLKKYQRLTQELGTHSEDLFRLALQSPDVLATPDSTTEITIEELKNALKLATSQCLKFQANEGLVLKEKIEGYIEKIGDKLKKIGELDKVRIEVIRKRISKNLDEIRDRVKLDENRFEQELIYYIEKLDITEERVRLYQHLDYFKSTMNSESSEGKKLGFISQEIGREINTIGSKANDSVIQQLVVEMKDELEKIKEQLLNIV